MIGLEYILRITNVGSTELAGELEIKKQNISRWFSGEREIPEKYFIILEKKFNVPSEYFYKELTIEDKIFILDCEKERLKKQGDLNVL